jgi:hypothetical protein
MADAKLRAAELVFHQSLHIGDYIAQLTMVHLYGAGKA